MLRDMVKAGNVERCEGCGVANDGFSLAGHWDCECVWDVRSSLFEQDSWPIQCAPPKDGMQRGLSFFFRSAYSSRNRHPGY